MEPMRPETKHAILQNRPEAQPDLAEYERLLSLRYTLDPSTEPSRVPPAAGAKLVARQSETAAAIEARLAELHRKLFGTDE